MTTTINQKLEELKDLIVNELSDTVTFVSISITCEGSRFEFKERSAESLKRDGISMRNIKGDFIEYKKL
jgi:hypothetical protein